MPTRYFSCYWFLLPFFSHTGQHLEEKVNPLSAFVGEWCLVKISCQSLGESRPNFYSMEDPLFCVKVDKSGKLVFPDDKAERMIRVNTSKNPLELDMLEKPFGGEEKKVKVFKFIYSLDKNEIKVGLNFWVNRIDCHPYFSDEIPRPASFEFREIPLAILYFERKRK
jgi:uncharacterized protein (TIGR03067 family)